METGLTSLQVLTLLLEPCLRQELGEPGGRETGIPQLGQHVPEVGPRVHAEPVAAEHQGVGGSSAVACGVAASEQVYEVGRNWIPSYPSGERRAGALEDARVPCSTVFSRPGGRSVLVPRQCSRRVGWSTWACPRQVRGWPRRAGPLRPRGVEAQAARARRAKSLPRTSWAGGQGRRVLQGAARLLHPLGSRLGRPQSAALHDTSAPALTLHMASILPIRPAYTLNTISCVRVEERRACTWRHSETSASREGSASPSTTRPGGSLSGSWCSPSTPALTLHMASILPIRCLYAPVWSFFGPKNRIWSRECKRSPRSQRAAP